jgi:septal ring factor EnvC (AmiA/AmiB activator)
LHTPISQSHLFRSFILALGLTLGASASAADSQQKLDQIRSSISQLKQTLGSAKQQQQRQRDELAKIEKEIASLSRQQRQTRKDLAEQQHAQHKLERETDTLRRKLAKQRANLGRQLRAGFSAGRQQALKLLLNQTNPAAAGRTLTYYGYFTRAQLQAVSETRRDINQLDNAETRLRQSRTRLEKLQDKQQRQGKALKQRRSERKTVLAKLNAEISSKEQRLNRLLEDEQALSKLLQNLKPAPAAQDFSNLAKLKGKLKWPTKGAIEHHYGRPRGQGRLKWQGVTIGGVEGQAIHSIAPGRVIFADWIRGYGLMLIVDHGNGYMSLYGHNQSLYKDVGDPVAANETVATLGNSGGNDSTSLYFELRRNGKPVNPETWCR